MPSAAPSVPDGRAPAPGPRLVGIDLARCAALFGMFAVHAAPFGMLAVAVGPLRTTVFDGRASALFCVLAGLSLSLVGARWAASGRDADDLDRWTLARAGVIVVLGLLLTELHQDVLPVLTTYGVLFALAAPARRLGTGGLAAAAAVLAVVAPVISLVVRGSLGLTPESAGELPTLAQLADPGPGWVTFAHTVMLDGFYPVLTWMPFLLAGMAIGRLDLRRTAVQLRLLAAGATLAVLALALSELLTAHPGGLVWLGHQLGVIAPTTTTADIRWALDQDWSGGPGTISAGPGLLQAAGHSGAPLEILGSIGSAALVIGASLLVARVAPRALLSPLAAVGGMTLTLYAAHVVVLRALSGDELFDGLHSGPVSVAAFLGLVLGALAFASAWRRWLGQGPLERLVAAAGAAATRQREACASPRQILLAGASPAGRAL